MLNDEAHHAYRIHSNKAEGEEKKGVEDEEDLDYEQKEATVWIGGLDKINKLRGINFCVDFSATPYFINRGHATNTIFPWAVSDFGLTDAMNPGW